MGQSGREPTPPVEPEIEKVRGGRRAAITVLVGAVVVVGALIWKPWDATSGAPQTTAVAILPAQSPAAIATTFVIEPPPIATPVPSQVVSGEGPPPLEQPQPTPSGEHFAAVLLASKGPYVRCTYGVGRDGREQLEALVVAPPVITFGHGEESDLVRTIVFRPELESNSLQGIFSAEWRFVEVARAQRWPLARGASVEFRPTRLKPALNALSDAGVFRVSVVVNWIGDAGEVLETQRVNPTSYGVVGSPDTTPDGCPARIDRGRPTTN
jgi:hypothetical protein